MDCKFQVGQRVAATCDIGGVVRRSEVLTVSDITAGTFALIGTWFVVEAVAIRLKEKPQPEGAWFPAECFRPVDESRLDQFRKHLAPADRVRDKAPACV